MDLSGLTLSPPPGWYALDADPVTREASAVRDVAERASSVPEIAKHQAEIVQALVRFGADADEKGALFCAVLWEPEPSGPVVATLVVVEVQLEGTGDVASEIEAIKKTLAASHDTDVGPRRVDEVRLPIGPAVRARFLVRADEPGEPAVVFDSTQLWIPLRDAAGGATTLAVVATTPALHAGDLVADAAAHVAGSLSGVV
ncbi:MAG: hypothetical protein AB1679_33715 [Actinomycetota bacterium]